MSNNSLHLNKSQSGIVLFGSADSVHLIHNHCGSLSVCIKLGVLFDSDLSLEFCFFQLRNITKIIFFIFSTLLSRRVWTTVTILTLSSSSLSCQHFRIRQQAFEPFQGNTITTMLSSLHWLPINLSILFLKSY